MYIKLILDSIEREKFHSSL